MEFILQKIKEFDTIIIHGHYRPDGDCIGSQYGLMHIIKATYPSKNVIITGETSDFVSFIGSPTLLEDESLFENALSICVDCATSERLSDTRYNKAKYSIKIDHHPFIEEFCDLELIEDTASSACEIIMKLILIADITMMKKLQCHIY